MALNYTPLPKAFADLAAVYRTPPGSFVSIIGVVVDLQTPTTTRTGDHMLTFKLLDERLRDAPSGTQGLTVRSFVKDQSLLPPVRGLGDVVLMRHAKTGLFGGQPMIMTNWQTKTIVIPAASIPAPTYSIAYMGGDRLKALGPPEDIEKLSVEESAYIIHLKAKKEITDAIPGPTTAQLNRKRDFHTVGGSTTPGPPAKKFKGSDTFGNKFRLIGEVAHRDFADLCVEVVKKFSMASNSTELYVTDYTENQLMWYYAPPEEDTSLTRDGDAFGHCQPPKRAWPGPYGYLVLKVNVKDPHAQYVNAQLEPGDLVLLRNVKMKIMATGAKLEGDMWPDSLNPEKHQDVAISPLRDILDPDNLRHTNTSPTTGHTYVLPFLNANYRARVRVVDFAPRNLADFAQPCLPDDDDQDEGDRSPIDLLAYPSSSTHPSQQKWEWYFSLTLEDATGAGPKERLTVHVCHAEAQFLLRDLEDPGDLRRHGALLARLREKLCVLWGDVEERVEKGEGEGEGVSNLPFECCVMEFGVPVGDGEEGDAGFGFRRVYRMFGTTIL
ncbi:ssDNA-binding domain of telomere protection protein [Teratosphaeria destructans]|uniref:Protection of telomeres protein 1 n=1 Tax=Teratosphaeria destructans TaxID=418781 RepID=A0A9W7SQU6_9PEZI|nr:ssDNA-binding domain of telomere protection protein [Teratosphaeria destructans]